MVQVDNSFNDREVVLRVGQNLEVNLSENASTGYRWSIPQELRGKWKHVLIEREGKVEASDGPPGSPGIRHLYFEAHAPGTAAIEIHYLRSWEKKPPARKFKLRVIVEP